MRSALAFLCAAFIVNAACQAQSIEPLDPEKKINGLRAADLSSEWWKWAVANPDKSPIEDTTGENCGVGQRGEEWFLAGGFGSSRITRRCTIPAGKYLFFPVVNMAYWPAPGTSELTCQQAKQSAALNNDTAIELFASVDGVEIPNVDSHRVRTDKCFDLFERVPASYGRRSAYPSASDGYWLLLPPLGKGKHAVKFGGMYNRASGAYGRMLQDIEYFVVVQ